MKHLFFFAAITMVFSIAGFQNVDPEVYGGQVGMPMCDAVKIDFIDCPQATCSLTYKQCHTAGVGETNTRLCDVLGSPYTACNLVHPNCNQPRAQDQLQPEYNNPCMPN